MARRGGRRGRGRGQGNRGRRSGRARGSVGGGKKKGGSRKGGASSGRRGGQGNRGRASGRAKGTVGGGASRSSSSKGGASTGRRGGQGNRNTPTGRAQGTVTKKTVSKKIKNLRAAVNRAKALGLGVGGDTLRGVGHLFRGRPAGAIEAGASVFNRLNQKPVSDYKYKQGLKRNLDYRNMVPGLKIGVDVNRALKHFKQDKTWLGRNLPDRIKNIKFNHQFYTPKRVRMGDPRWSAPGTLRGNGIRTRNNQRQMRISESLRNDPRVQADTFGGRKPKAPPNVYTGWLDFYTDENQRRLEEEYNERKFERDSREFNRGKRRPAFGGRDWLDNFYRTYNIGGRGGRLDDKARDYWTNEAATKGRGAVMDIIRGTAQADGTWGGRDRPRRLIGRRIDHPNVRSLPWFGPKTGKPNRRILRGIPLDQLPQGRPWRTTYPSKAERERRRAEGTRVRRPRFRPEIHHRDGGFRVNQNRPKGSVISVTPGYKKSGPKYKRKPQTTSEAAISRYRKQPRKTSATTRAAMARYKASLNT